LEKRAGRILDVEFAASVFASAAVFYLAPELMGHELHAVADAKDGDTEVKDRRIGLGRAFGVDAGRATAEDDATRVEFGDFLGGEVVANDLGVDLGFADAPSDDLGVLGTEVENNDAGRG
jgi:hypothetical protein